MFTRPPHGQGRVHSRARGAFAPLPLLLARFDSACGTGAARAEPSAGAEVALPRHVVDLDADAVGILEQKRVVAGSEMRSTFQRVNDAGPDVIAHKASS